MRMRATQGSSGVEQEGEETAESAGLRYVSDDELGIVRIGVGKRFSYRSADGRTVRDRKTLARIRALAIPPAWIDVRICPFPEGHIQAVGRDAKGRKQYRYHPRWREVRDETKYEHMLAFGRALPEIRRRVAADLGRPALSRKKVLAVLVTLLDATLVRIGNPEYADQNNSYGLTTLRNRHAAVNGSELRLKFKGKSGRIWKLKFHDRRIARIVKACQSLPGQHLFQYVDDQGERHPVTSSDVNAYLRNITGAEITAKDFRTWAGTVLAGFALRAAGDFDSERQAKHNLKAAIDIVAKQLGNTSAVCRKCYVHPDVVECYFRGTLAAELVKPCRSVEGLDSGEVAMLALLERRNGGRRSRSHRAAA
jgi:DNA topoisomerase-1